VQPKISVIIPVLNEGKQIQVCLQHLGAGSGEIDYEVIVVDGDANGSTLSYLPTGLPQLRALTAVAGRGSQMNAGAKVARGNLLLFLHADAQLPTDGLTQIVDLMQSQQFVGGAFDLKINSPRPSLQVISWGACLRSRLTRIPYGDQAIFLRRDYFESIGGYLAMPIMEDVALMQRVKHLGDRIYIFPQPVLVSARRWQAEGVIHCTLRNWILLLLYFAGVKPQRLAHWYPRFSCRAPS
jgi:uncharacterized protein